MGESRTLEGADEYDDLLHGEEHRWRSRLIGPGVLAALIAAGAYALWALVLSGGTPHQEQGR